MEFTKPELKLMHYIIEFYQGEQSFSRSPCDPHESDTEALRKKVKKLNGKK